MAPQRPSESKHRSRPSSGAPESPTKTSPRKSGERRKPRDPEREKKRSSGASPEKRRSRHHDRAAVTPTGGAAEEVLHEKRRSGHHGSSPRKSDARRKSGSPRKQQERIVVEYDSSVSGSRPSSGTGGGLSMGSLAKLNAMNEKDPDRERNKGRDRDVREKDKAKVVTGRVMKERHKQRTRRRDSDAAREKEDVRPRVVSGNTLERGLGQRGGFLEKARASGSGASKKKKWICIAVGVVVLLLIIIIPVGVLVIGKKGGKDDKGSSDSDSSEPKNSNLDDIDPSSIPSSAKGGYLDPFSWYDTDDFNVTYTEEEVGGLSTMGLFSKWDDSKRANDNVPPLNKEFKYGDMPIRGINVGGWLNLEPFITPSMFNYNSKENVIDEYTLMKKLGPSAAKQTMEKHYSSFINKQSFEDIQEAGFDHVRIPFNYWAIKTYDGDPYVPRIAWRYLLRGIEYARQCGLRVNLDVHGLPGSQNGWNHSGRQGTVNWLNGTDGDLNGQRSLDLHDQLSKFFAQPRYKNIIAIYGLVNEPKMTKIVTQDVLTWNKKAIDIVRKNGVKAWIVFGDGFLGIPNWKGKMQNVDDNIMLDAHQYVIFNTDLLAFDHAKKLDFACTGWSKQMKQSMDPSTGFGGPTICAEWSQADTDCAPNLNNAGTGSRWTGTLNYADDSSQSVTTPSCPTGDDKCSCDGANADPADYSKQYKQWLLYNAEAQMNSYEKGYGWFYWTWRTEKATQWSWKLGMDAGILPKKVWDREYNCSGDTPDWDGLPETY